MAYSTLKIVALLPLLFFFFSCSLPPERIVTLREFKELNIHRFFDCYNSSEEIIEHLNRDGEVTFECRTKTEEKKHYYLRVFATPDGLIVRAAETE